MDNDKGHLKICVFRCLFHMRRQKRILLQKKCKPCYTCITSKSQTSPLGQFLRLNHRFKDGLEGQRQFAEAFSFDEKNGYQEVHAWEKEMQQSENG